MGMTTSAAAQVKTSSGLVEGAASADGAVRMFKGIPFATISHRSSPSSVCVTASGSRCTHIVMDSLPRRRRQP
jgi:hypothetical protein